MSNLPMWAEEMSTLLPACAHYLVSGNTRDVYLVAAGALGELGAPPDQQLLVSFPDILEALLKRRGIGALISYDITTGVAPVTSSSDAIAEMEGARERTLAQLAPPDAPSGLADLVHAVTEAQGPVGLLIHSASRLVRDPEHLSDREFEFYRRVDRIARDARPGENGLFNPIVWLLDREQDMPPWFVVGNEKLRSLVVPLPDTGDRVIAAERFIEQLAPSDIVETSSRSLPQAVLAEHTAGLTLVAMENIVGVAHDQGLGRDRLEDAARAYRVGILDNPWRRPYLAERVRRELTLLDAASERDGGLELESTGAGANGDGEHGLVDRVLGQEPAVRKALDILVRSVSSLTAAHASGASRPRGVLFFAGPTGVGKTELAKGLTKLVFDDESLSIRFDMSEFSAEHAADRLIGAPPGYTGYERGGELTNAVRRQPFSLVLFDEVEKADPRVLDKFLQLLDDGRLTDGRGETAYFTEAIIVFTSNLGIYKDRVHTDEDGNKSVVRELNVDPDKHGPAEVETKVKEGIREHFTLRLGRPELLNRIGSDNIVVFDFIRHETGSRIVAKMVRNVLARVRDEHDLDVVIGGRASATLADECLHHDALIMGGRGIGARVETVLVNSIAAAMFRERSRLGDRAELADLVPLQGGTWQAVLKPA